jgi:hypothetical protein
MAKCFVIQPFDRDVFDRRYKDTFKPAIEEAGFEPYRVDEDPGVQIPIEEIEKGIREAAVCFAEITTDNANVWYELGFAIACGKPVVMVCERSRPKFPFDVQHRSIVIYDTGSSSDFDTLRIQIAGKLKAFGKTENASLRDQLRETEPSGQLFTGLTLEQMCDELLSEPIDSQLVGPGEFLIDTRITGDHSRRTLLHTLWYYWPDLLRGIRDRLELWPTFDRLCGLGLVTLHPTAGYSLTEDGKAFLLRLKRQLQKN